MKSAMVSCLVTASSFLAIASATRTVQMNIVKNHDVERANLQKRATVTAVLGNAESFGLYYVNVTVGSPPQDVQLQIDTGSSDVWVPSSSAKLCLNSARGGCYGGTFTSSTSSTFSVVGANEFNISYVDGSGASGDYFTDSFSVGGANLNRFQMGLAKATTIPVGIMGIAYNNSEANVFTGTGTSYPNLVDALVSSGQIPTQAYSLWLDDLQASTGSILFGGIDTKKYIGNLQSIKIYPTSKRGATSFTVAFTSLSATSSSGTDTFTATNFAEAAILDSGTTLTILPDSLANAIFTELGATVSKSLGATVVPCTLGQNTGTINFGFGGVGGPIIKVPASELVLPLTLSNGKSPTYSNGAKACQLGIQAAGNLPTLFGDTFLRSAYVVYDLANNRIALAQTDFNATGSNVVPFASQGAAIPSATTATGEAAVTQTATGIPRSGSASAAADSTVGAALATGTGLSAVSGFQTNKASAATRPEPISWAKVVLMTAMMCLTFISGSIFATI